MEPHAVKRPQLEEPIIFIEQDAEGIQIPYNDAVVITANIADYNVHRIFIDNESSVDICTLLLSLQWGLFQNS